MENLRGRNSVLMIVVVVLAGGIFYVIRGGSSDDGPDPAVKKPHNAFEMTVSSVGPDGTFRGKVERSGRHATAGLGKIGTYDRVHLRLAELEPLEPVLDPCWTSEGKAAIEDVMGARIWVDPRNIQQYRGVFEVRAWNRAGEFVQEELLRDGDATVLGGQGRSTVRKALAAAEEEAADAKRGLWAKCGDS